MWVLVHTYSSMAWWLYGENHSHLMSGTQAHSRIMCVGAPQKKVFPPFIVSRLDNSRVGLS